MKIFILSSSILENTIFSNLYYLINRDITKIIMLRENHTSDEYTDHMKNKVILCNTISEATEICDIAIIILPNDTLYDKYKKIYEYVKTKVLKTYYLNFENFSNYNNQFPIISNINDIPTILILAIGNFHQVLNLEISLNELFSEKNVDFYQSFSPATTRVLEELKKQKLLNHKVERSLCAPNYDIKIVTWCCTNFQDAFNDLSLLEAVHNTSPSYFFLVSERNILENEELQNALMNRLNCSFNSILYSDYVSIVWDEVATPIRISNDFNLYLNKEKKELLWNEILKRIAFPKDVKVIRANEQ